MTKENKKNSDDFSIDGTTLSEGGIFLLFALLICALSLCKMPKIRPFRLDSPHFHIIPKKKIIKILGIDILLILTLICTLAPVITLNTLYFISIVTFAITLLSTVSCDMHVTASADNNNLYICYDYLFYKEKVNKIPFRKIKKIKITDDKVKIITNFRRYLLTIEPDSEAYNYFLRLKQILDV